MRRTYVVALGATLSVLLAVPAFGGGDGAAAEPPTTLDQTIVGEGDRDLGFGPGQKRVTRSLGGSKKGKGRSLAAFKQLSDVHLVDEESPGRVEFFDMCSFGRSAYRPQEAMSAQVAETMIRTLNGFSEGPATGADLDFTISTGDNIDNNQRNELGWFVDLLNGGSITPDSGLPGYDGYTQAHFAEALPDDLLELAQASFDAEGAGKWYAVLGNHDGLVQGNLPANSTFKILVSQGKKVFIDPIEYEAEGNCPPSVLEAEDAFFEAYFGDQTQIVPSDSSRIFASHDEVVTTIGASGGEPKGHGMANAGDDPAQDGKAGYYRFNVSKKVVGLSLDTLSPFGLDDGILTNHQYGWLETQLRKYSKTYYTENGKKRKNRKGRNKLIMLFSHHTSRTLHNATPPPDDAPVEQVDAAMPFHCFAEDDGPGCEGAEGLRELIQRYPNVIAWVNGHEHNNRVTPFEAPQGADAARGFWEVNTAAHIDWPQQSRLIEVAWKAGKKGKSDTVFIYGTVVDHGAGVDPDPDTMDPVEYLASLSRVEAYYDACVREFGADCDAAGSPGDRNVKLVLKAPFNLGK